MSAGLDDFDTKFGGGEDDSDDTDTDTATDSDVGVSDFLTNTDPIDGQDFVLASGANWTKAAAGVIGGTITATVLGIQSFAANVLDAFASILDGLGDFAGSLVFVIGNDATEGIREAFDITLPSVDVLAPVVAIGVTLAAFFVFANAPRLLEVLR
jgi:hypothetical protein